MPAPADRESWRCEAFDSLDALPLEAWRLFDTLAAGSVFSSVGWYRCLIATAMPAGTQPCLVLCLHGDRPMALFPLQRNPDGTLQSLTGPYTCLYQPLLGDSRDAATLRQIGFVFGRFCRRHASIRIEALDADWPGLPPILDGLRQAGLAALRFDHFGNWHEDVTDLSWVAYLQTRDGALRETVRRKLGKALRDPAIRFDLIRDTAGLEDGIAAFEDVYARSWKDSEPYPRFNAAFMHMAAIQGVLRLGVLRQAGHPVAVQYWVVASGTATVLKLAHDEAFKPLSPGTVLTALMLRGLLDDEHVTGLDFGRGDDPYKRQWVSHRRQRIGLMLANPRRPGGLRLILTHLAGTFRRHLHGMIKSK